MIYNISKFLFILLFISNLSASDLRDLRILLGEEKVILLEEKPIIEEKVVVTKETKLIEEIKGMDYFLGIKEKYYTLNLGTTNGIEKANKFVELYGLDINNTYLYEFGPNMQSAKVLFGVYKSVKDAAIAMGSLPKEVKNLGPYIDNISKHQVLYFKYH